MSAPNSQASTALSRVRQWLRHRCAQAGAGWHARPARERRWIAVGLAAVLAMLAWTLALQPALITIVESREHLPRLYADAARVSALVAEAQSLERGRADTVDAERLSEALRASLHRAGLAAVSAVSEGAVDGAQTTRQWVVTFHRGEVAGVMQWLADLPYMLRVRIQAAELVRAIIDGRDRPGFVSGSIRLVLPAGVGAQ